MRWCVERCGGRAARVRQARGASQGIFGSERLGVDQPAEKAAVVDCSLWAIISGSLRRSACRPPGAGPKSMILSAADHLQIVFDDNERNGDGEQGVETIEQLDDVGVVQAGCRLVVRNRQRRRALDVAASFSR